MMKLIYQLEHVNKTYKKGKVVANQNISFDVQQGEILGLLGPNGAGKSTLIKQMVGHLVPTSGTVRYKGTSVQTQTKRVAQEVAYYSQEPHALTSLKTWEALYFTGRLRGLTKESALKQTEELLERFGMQDLRHKLLKNVSGGQKRLIGIGTCLIGFSPVMILDEPTNELDPKKRRLVWDLIQERNRQGVTVILVTHNVLEAEQVVDRVAVVNHGKLLAIDHVGVLKQRVDQRMKLEITTSFGESDYVCRSLSALGHWTKTGENRIRTLIEKQNASYAIDCLTEQQLPIEEYSLVPPNLEDVYFHIDDDQDKPAKAEVV
ncbi:MAG: ABC transporter ATP-binding protein [Paenibacillus lautus]|jgi:ABC-2 type transport system ATP-binding protein|uniref:ABC transporter ATP-binding protein n=1 Tax=Paenibacillus lautus TaxID=1401 RepID=UPI0026ED326A|nr:ABC transporter ATP-binding protein [Paenibacillus lautus]MCI1776999.1 ABC transporter ATP-binding protein [Paenibacillus lautus]